MQLKNNNLGTLIKVSLCSVLALGFVSSLGAADATGSWTWMQAGRGGGAETKITLKLKVEGEKLTGTVTQPGRGGGAATDVAISEGKVKGEELSFSVVRDMGGTPMTTKYSGKLAGDTIKGKIEREGRGGGAPTTTDWEAKREAAAAPAPAAPAPAAPKK
jgi:hypothetical protein